VAGSGPSSEVGRLFQIDPATKQVVSQAEGIDALSILVLKTPEGKRLYYGAARESLIYSIALDERGAFVASEVLAKHDETYMPPEVAKALKESGRWQETQGKGTAQPAGMQ